MSDADSEVVVTTDGVTVRKTLDAERFEHPTVVIGIHAEREGPVRVRLTDRTPAAWSPENIGFDPEYGADHWSVEDGRLVFERVLSPGQRYTTLYNIRDDPIGEPLAYDPAVETEAVDPGAVDPEGDEAAEGATAEVEDGDALDDLVSASDNDPVRGVIAGESDSLREAAAEGEADAPEPSAEATPAEAGADADGPSREEEADPSAGEETSPEPEPTPAVVSVEDGTEREPAVEGSDSGSEGEPKTGELATEARDEAVAVSGSAATGTDDPGADASGDEESSDAEAGAGDDTAEATPAGAPADQPAGGVARVLAKELREDRVSEADRELLREELAAGPESTEARISHLQNEVSDLAAYTDALEEFLDEKGTAEQVLAGVEDRVADLEDRVTGFEDGLADVRDDLVAMESDLGDDLSALREDLDRLDDRLAGVEDRVADTAAAQSDLEAVESEVASLREDVAEVEQFREELTTTLGRLTGGLDDAGN